MAYAFVASSSQYFSSTTLPVSALPVTMSLLGYPNNTTADFYVVSLTKSTANNPFLMIQYCGTTAGDPVRAWAYSDVANSGDQKADSTAGYSANTWARVSAVFAGLSSRTIYLNSTGTTTTTTNAGGFTGLNRFGIGAMIRTSVDGYFDGKLAEVALWSVALTADEVASLARGFKPHRVRPQSLVYYAPFVRETIDIKGAIALTNNNSATVADHPRVY